LQVNRQTSQQVFEYISSDNYIIREIELPGFSDEEIAYVRKIMHVTDFGIIEGGSWDTLWITLDDPDHSNAVYQELLKRFTTNNYRVADTVAILKANRDYQKGLHDLTMLAFAVFFIVMLIIVFIRVTGYVEAQSRNIYLLRLVGAQDADIYGSLMKRVVSVATAGVTLSFALGFGIFGILAFMALLISSESVKIILNAPTIATMLSSAVLFYAAYLLPMHLSLKKKLMLTLDELGRESLCQ
jgi:ABC-type antimicrobial peptide transport system permease subunit